MIVKDIMTPAVITVGQDEPVEAAARLLQRHNLGALPVCDAAGRLRGFLTDRDIVLRCVAAGQDPGAVPVREIMSRRVTTARAEDSVEQASRLMAGEQIRRLPVTEDGRVVGMVTLCDLARQSALRMEAGEALGHISANLRRL